MTGHWPSFLFYMLKNGDGVEVHKYAKNKKEEATTQKVKGLLIVLDTKNINKMIFAFGAQHVNSDISHVCGTSHRELDFFFDGFGSPYLLKELTNL